MILFFRNFDNGWKYPKMIGAAMGVALFLIFILKVIRGTLYYPILEIPIFGFGIFICFLLYAICKYQNTMAQIRLWVGASKNSEIKQRIQDKKSEIMNSVDDKTKKTIENEFQGCCTRLSKAHYLSNLEYRIGRIKMEQSYKSGY